MRQFSFQDDQYPFVGVTHQRQIARALVLNERGYVALHVVSRDDMFCNQTYYETPGGGVDEGETYEEALLRECEEEIGYRVEILAPLAEVHDFYNLIGRENQNRYYLARLKEKVGVHFASSGDSFIQKTIFVPLDEAIELYQKQDETLVAGLVKQRELPILLLAKEYLEKNPL